MFQPKLGVSLGTLSQTLTDEVLQAVAESQIATLEIGAALFDDAANRAQMPALKAMLQQHAVRPMTIHARFGNAYDVSSLDEAIIPQALASAKAAIDLAQELGAPMIVMHASAEPITPAERQQRLRRAQTSFTQIGAWCRAAHKRVAIELLPRTCLGNTVEELLALLDGLDGDTFGVCLDTNHLMDRFRALPEDVRTLGDRLITLHLSDYDGIDEKHELPGTGVLDWRGFMQALRDIDYDGPFNYECKPAGETAAARIQTLEENFKWLSSL